jgi:hypothetical protein
MRVLAEEMKDLKSLSIMLGVADYDTLADPAEKRARTSRPLSIRRAAPLEL